MQGSHSNGWFACNRAMITHDIVGAGSEGRYSRFEAWCWLIAHAAFEEHNVTHSGRVVHLLPGELIVSRRELAKTWSWSQSAVRWFLERLGNSQACNLATAHNTTILSLINYEKYQIRPSRVRPHNNQVPALNPPTVYNKEQLTNNTSPNGEEATRVEITTSEAAFLAYNVLAGKLGLPQATTLTPTRKRQLSARLKEHGAESWQRALANVEASPFLRGENDRGWRASLDFILQASSYTKLLDGAYDGTHLTRLHAAKAVGTRVRDTSESIGDMTARLIREGKYTPEKTP